MHPEHDPVYQGHDDVVGCGRQPRRGYDPRPLHHVGDAVYDPAQIRSRLSIDS